MGLKFNLMVKGYECTISTATLWDLCQQEKIDYAKWKMWIEEKLQKNAVKKGIQKKE